MISCRTSPCRARPALNSHLGVATSTPLGRAPPLPLPPQPNLHVLHELFFFKSPFIPPRKRRDLVFHPGMWSWNQLLVVMNARAHTHTSKPSIRYSNTPSSRAVRPWKWPFLNREVDHAEAAAVSANSLPVCLYICVCVCVCVQTGVIRWAWRGPPLCINWQDKPETDQTQEWGGGVVVVAGKKKKKKNSSHKRPDAAFVCRSGACLAVRGSKKRKIQNKRSEPKWA